MPRGAVGAAGTSQVLRNTDNDIWAADLHLSPNGRFLYASERTTSTIGTLRVDGANGKLIYLASTPTEKQPRGFNVDPSGRSIIRCFRSGQTIRYIRPAPSAQSEFTTCSCAYADLLLGGRTVISFQKTTTLLMRRRALRKLECDLPRL